MVSFLNDFRMNPSKISTSLIIDHCISLSACIPSTSPSTPWDAIPIHSDCRFYPIPWYSLATRKPLPLVSLAKILSVRALKHMNPSLRHHHFDGWYHGLTIPRKTSGANGLVLPHSSNWVLVAVALWPSFLEISAWIWSQLKMICLNVGIAMS